MRLSRFPLVVVLVVAACHHSLSPDLSAQSIPVRRLRPEPVSLTFNSGLSEPERVVIRDAASWASKWAAIWARQAPAPPLPAVDFARDIVVVAALGQRPSGGFGILVDSATAHSNGLEVTIRTISPGPGCGSTMALTQPVDVAVLARTPGEVRFVDRAEQNSCQ